MGVEQSAIRQVPALASSLLLLATLGFAASTATAQEMFARTTIEDSSLKEMTGSALVNQAAGEGNLQFNGALLAVHPAGPARTSADVVQLSGARDDETELVAIATIANDAFAGGRGTILVTQAAGINNQQINLFAAVLGLNGEVVLESELSQTHASGPLPEDFEPQGARLTQVSAGAFRDAAGVVQVNQVAGRENSTFNRFVLGVEAGALP